MTCQRFAVRIDPEHPALAEQLAAALDLPLYAGTNPVVPEFTLEFDREGRLTLRDNQRSEWNPIRPSLAPRFRSRGSDPLLRAMGPRSATVLDGTAGLGGDTAQLAAFGKTVQALEVHPVIHALLADALAHCADPMIRDAVTLELADTISWLESTGANPDTIYLDPMYPPPRGSAAPRKEAQILRRLTEPDPEADRQLLAVAIRHARHRVVVKRPHHASPLLPGKHGEVRGKLVRFDIYSPLK